MTSSTDQWLPGETLMEMAERLYGGTTVLEDLPLPKVEPGCCCRQPQRGRPGGCKPGLQLRLDGSLRAFCLTCRKPLQAGRHRRRDQTWALGLASLYAANRGHVDLDDIEAMGLLDREGAAGEASPAPEGTTTWESVLGSP